MVLVDGMHFSARFSPTPLWVALASQITWPSNRTFAHGKSTQTYICCNVDQLLSVAKCKWGRAGSGRKVPPVNKDVKENNQIMACLFIQTQPPTDWRILYFRLAVSKLVHQHVDQLPNVDRINLLIKTIIIAEHKLCTTCSIKHWSQS